MDRIRVVADYIREEMAAGRVANSRLCRPIIKAKFPDATDRDCAEVGLLLAADVSLGDEHSPGRQRWAFVLK